MKCINIRLHGGLVSDWFYYSESNMIGHDELVALVKQGFVSLLNNLANTGQDEKFRDGNTHQAKDTNQYEDDGDL